MRDLTLIDFEAALFPDGTPNDPDGIGVMLASIVLELLVAVHGHDVIMELLTQLGELERACGHSDDE